MLELAAVRAGHGGRDVIHDVSLTVGDAEIVALLGPNGAGKTTLLHTISGAVRPTAGTVTWRGTRIDGARPRRIAQAGIAHCPQGRRLFAGLTVRENLMLGAITPSARAAATATLSTVLGHFPALDTRLNVDAALLSGGEAQMCAIGRALMGRPALLLLDEPSLGLAPRVLTALLDAVATVRRAGTAVLLVEQNVAAALAVADRGYVLEDGRVAAADTAAALAADPAVRRAYLGP